MNRISLAELQHNEEFVQRHIGPSNSEICDMLESLGYSSLETLTKATLPDSICRREAMQLGKPKTEQQSLAELRHIANKNIVKRSFIGTGYYNTYIPPVILRNVLENPGWYTAYTPYQPEIAQGRLEALLTYQQMVLDLTGMELANASMLDEGTAAAEAMSLLKRVNKKNHSPTFIVAEDTHPQTIAVIKTRAKPLGLNIVIGNPQELIGDTEAFGVLLQYPGTYGDIENIEELIDMAHGHNILVTVAADIMALCLLTPPGELDADVVVGNSQRFGVPMGFGGPHAAFFATRNAYKRSTPGRIIGVSRDSNEKQALRMAMQTREQHIRREKATSNICTSQALLAIISAFYAMYHGPEGLKRIATRIHTLTMYLAEGMTRLGIKRCNRYYFDTLTLRVNDYQKEIYQRALDAEMNLRLIDKDRLGISIDETTTIVDIENLWRIFAGGSLEFDLDTIIGDLNGESAIPPQAQRQSTYLQHPLFTQFHSETEMLRYMKRLEDKDIALNRAMIPLGSCTMKLNSTAEMIPIGWPEFSNMHPFAPLNQAAGYVEMIAQLEDMLLECTGYDAISMQPNAGSQGEYAGLLAIQKYHQSRGDAQRDICLIPSSAHGTNPASAALAGMRVIIVECDSAGNVDLQDLREKAERHSDELAALMATYPSTHGVFEESIIEMCELIHQHGGQVYVDGANLNALVGLAAPGKFGADVSHINLHKTFCIPHGGGGPGVGPIGVRSHLTAFLPGHTHLEGTAADNNPVSAAPWGSAGILAVSWTYIALMGANGLKRATEMAILNANYMARRLEPHFPVLYKGANGLVAHECIIDVRPLKEAADVSVEDIAKRLMDYGFHAPTMSWPVAGTLMIEPTESESKTELDRFCDAMIAIREEVRRIESSDYDRESNPLSNAPHTVDEVMGDWDRTYDTEVAAYPVKSLRDDKYWPPVNRIDQVYGDRHLVCSCPPLDAYMDAAE